MTDPVTITMLVMATATSIASTIQQSQFQSAAADRDAAIQRQNAAIQAENAAQAQREAEDIKGLGKIELDRFEKERRLRRGRAIARAGASGVRVAGLENILLEEEQEAVINRKLIERDTDVAVFNILQSKRTAEIESNRATSEAELLRAKSKSIRTGGKLQSLETLFSSAGKFAERKAKASPKAKVKTNGAWQSFQGW